MKIEGPKPLGACICLTTPEQASAANLRMMTSSKDPHGAKAMLDHRCPHHGEKAQPALWGRHKELVLMVLMHEWESLSVTP